MAQERQGNTRIALTTYILGDMILVYRIDTGFFVWGGGGGGILVCSSIHKLRGLGACSPGIFENLRLLKLFLVASEHAYRIPELSTMTQHVISQCSSQTN